MCIDSYKSLLLRAEHISNPVIWMECRFPLIVRNSFLFHPTEDICLFPLIKKKALFKISSEKKINKIKISSGSRIYGVCKGRIIFSRADVLSSSALSLHLVFCRIWVPVTYTIFWLLILFYQPVCVLDCTLTSSVYR